MKLVSGDDLAFIGECFLADLDINGRQELARKSIKKDVNRLVQIFSSHSDEQPIAYNAFDGDHFHLLQAMRKYTLNNKRIPANPESILGYKNVVSRYLNKNLVLLDDLAILQNCDELLVFTDYSTRLEDVLRLPEGVLIEIAFFLKRRLKPSISFISISKLLRGAEADCLEFDISFDQLEDALKQTERAEIIDMANNDFKVDSDLKSLVYYITDPLDYKYSEWLRDGKYNANDEIGLVPGLTVRVTDLEPGVENLGGIVLSWAVLLKKLSKKRAFWMDSFENNRSPSLICEALKKFCIQLKGANYLETRKWSNFSIPKSLQKERWPITRFESKNIT